MFSKRGLCLYNIFVPTTISALNHPEEEISKLFSVIGQPARIQILLVLGEREACVCHLEAALDMRQASISQHLMVLRKAGLVSSQRDGRNIFYHLLCPEILQAVRQVAGIAGIPPEELQSLGRRPIAGCCCPQCNPGIDPRLACKKSN